MFKMSQQSSSAYRTPWLCSFLSYFRDFTLFPLRGMPFPQPSSTSLETVPLRFSSLALSSLFQGSYPNFCFSLPQRTPCIPHFLDCKPECVDCASWLLLKSCACKIHILVETEICSKFLSKSQKLKYII